MKKLVIFLLAICLGSFAANAQIKTPQPSPTCKLSQEVGLSNVAIEYSRPSMKGRKIFGDLVPFNEMWRTGANASTKITFGDDVTIGGANKLAKGTYALYTIPGEKTWTIIIHKNTTYWGTGGKDYKVEEDACRFEVAAQSLNQSVENFTMDIGTIKNSGADIVLTWENTRVSIPFALDTDKKVMEDIKTQMAGPSASTYYQAARYYLEEKKDFSQALVWVNMAMEKGGEKFWMMRNKALILGELGRYKEAIETAEKSSEMAKADDNQDYPRMNEKNISEWKMKTK
jgi:tetratricopeptide (TPR) repeat protein